MHSYSGSAKKIGVGLIAGAMAAYAALFFTGCAAHKRQDSAQVEQKMLSLEELFKDIDMTPVSSYLLYEGKEQIKTLSKMVHKFYYDPGRQSESLDRRGSVAYQMKNLATEIGFDESKTKEMAEDYLKFHTGVDVHNYIKVIYNKDKSMKDVIYTGKDKRVRRSGLVRKDGHIMLTGGRRVYISEAALNQSEKIRRLRLEKYSLKHPEQPQKKKKFWQS